VATDKYPDPLQYLSRVERLLVGWSVVRQFQTNTPRFEKRVRSSGPHAAAYMSAGQTFSMYVWACALPAIIFGIVGLPEVASVLYVLAGVCFLWGLGRALSGLKPQREYRRARSTHDETAS
jgi:hypothetical protein